MITDLPKIRKFTDKLFVFFIFASLLYFLINSISLALTQPFAFDGAINAQVAKELEKNFTYATTYNGINKFDPSIQTGLPVTLPVALLFKLFGASFESGLFVNVIYINLLLLAIVFYLKRCLKFSNPFIFLSILFFFSVPDLPNFGYGLYGEVPALFFFFLTIILLHFSETGSPLKYVFGAGLCLGIAYLTKTVVLIALPALVFVQVFDYFFANHRNLISYAKKSALFVLGFIVPVVLFEIYKVTSLGSRQYATWWKTQLDGIFLQAGLKSGFADTSGIIAKFSLHFDLLSTYLRISKVSLGLLLLILLISFLTILVVVVRNRLKSKPGIITQHQVIPNSSFVILIVTLSYFGWWLLITTTQKAWYRRIFDGTILLCVCLVMILSFVYIFGKRLFEESKYKYYQPWIIGTSNFLFVILLAASIYNFIQTKNGNITFQDSPNKVAAMNAGRFINTLPADAVVYGYGWWQAPIISFTSGENFSDLSKYVGPDYFPELKNAYLAIDSFEQTTLNLYDPILNQYNHELLFFDTDIYVYKLSK